MIIDVRKDDFAVMFSVSASGKIEGRPGVHRKRANWNIGMLGLDLREKERAKNMMLLRACERAVATCSDPSKQKERAALEEILHDLLPVLAQIALFFEVFGIPMSPDLSARLAREPRE
jgi:hypothetical protein